MKRLSSVILVFSVFFLSTKLSAQLSKDCATTLGALPSITFNGLKPFLTPDMKSMLASVAIRLKNSPDCQIVLIGYCTSGKSEMSAGTSRLEYIRRYFVENQNIANDRITVLAAQPGGDCNTVDLRSE